MQDFSLAMFLAGVAVFIFGMSLLEEALRMLASRSFKKFLQNQTNHKLRAIVGGVVVTGILQGSSVVLLMVLSFVGAGIMSFRNALAVMLGSNLGSTFSNWMVALVGFKLNLEEISYPILAIALVGFLFKNKKVKAINRFLIGFALLFVGLEWMKGSVSHLVQQFDLTPYLVYSYYWFIVIGFIITSLVQSSSAMVAISLTALYNRVLPFEAAACMVLGAELGTTLKLVIGSLGGLPDKKRVALGNFIFNFATIIISIGLLPSIMTLLFETWSIQDPLIALVVFQTVINLAGIVLFYPFLGSFASFLERRYVAQGDEAITQYIRQSAQPFSNEALPLARQETIRLFRHALDFNRYALGIHNGSTAQSWLQRLKVFAVGGDTHEDAYKRLKILQGEILEYLAELPREDMKQQEVEQAAVLLTASREIVHAAKNIKDSIHNWQDLESSSNDHLHQIYLYRKEEEARLLDSLQTLLVQSNDLVVQEKLEQWQSENRERHQKDIESVMQLLKEEKITELDASTLLNLYRELYSSHKALVAALADLHEPVNTTGA
ncbi:MAG: Na/Pi cotransporter family protein [Bacteroidota bacterium]